MVQKCFQKEYVGLTDGIKNKHTFRVNDRAATWFIFHTWDENNFVKHQAASKLETTHKTTILTMAAM